MSTPMLSLTVLPDRFAVCRLRADENIPSWAPAGSFYSVTRTPDELSIVCPQGLVPEGVEAVRGWNSLKVEGKLDLNLVGVLSSLTTCLAQAKISTFAISTYDTDYLFVKESDLNSGVAALREAGHHVTAGGSSRTIGIQ
jgi:hypothetical protein